MPWQPYTNDGLVFDLSHLDDFEHTYIQAATTKNTEKRYAVLVTFTDHPFTDSSNEDAVPVYSRTYSREGIKNRYFNFRRWMYSRQLPALIREFATGNKHFYVLQDGAYFRLEVLNDQNQVIEYDIFFDLYKENKRLILIVKSAYERDPNSNERPKLDRTNNFGFFTLLNATSKGKRIHRKY